VGLTPHPHL